MDVVPTTFGRTVPVPGLTSLAGPPFVDPPGPKVADRGKVPQKDPRRNALWYPHTFRLDQGVPAVAVLKIRKAMFGSRVILNGQVLGDHRPSFTPGYFNAKPAPWRSARTNCWSGSAPIATPWGRESSRESTSRRSGTFPASSTPWS